MWLCFICRTDCLFSPDDRLVVTGTSVKKGEGCGKLVVFDRQTLERVAELEVAQQTVVLLLLLVLFPARKYKVHLCLNQCQSLI